MNHSAVIEATDRNANIAHLEALEQMEADGMATARREEEAFNESQRLRTLQSHLDEMSDLARRHRAAILQENEILADELKFELEGVIQWIAEQFDNALRPSHFESSLLQAQKQIAIFLKKKKKAAKN